MINRPASYPVLLTVCLPADDETFRLTVDSVVESAGPNIHVAREGMAGVVTLLQGVYPDAGIEPVVLREPETGTAKQIWWYVHRDGRPQQVM